MNLPAGEAPALAIVMALGRLDGPGNALIDLEPAMTPSMYSLPEGPGLTDGQDTGIRLAEGWPVQGSPPQSCVHSGVHKGHAQQGGLRPSQHEGGLIAGAVGLLAEVDDALGELHRLGGQRRRPRSGWSFFLAMSHHFDGQVAVLQVCGVLCGVSVIIISFPPRLVLRFAFANIRSKQRANMDLKFDKNSETLNAAFQRPSNGEGRTMPAPPGPWRSRSDSPAVGPINQILNPQSQPAGRVTRLHGHDQPLLHAGIAVGAEAGISWPSSPML